MVKTLVVLFVFCLLGWFLFTYKLTDVPPGINGDEAAIGFLASEIVKTGKDPEGNILPLFTKVSWPDWKQPVTIYSTVIAFKIFGTSYFNLKAVSVVFVLISGILVFFLTKEIYNQKLALISLLIFIVTPILMIQAHLAIENIAPLPFIVFWMLMIIKYEKQKRNKHLFLAGLALGASIYSYLGLRLIVPVISIVTIFYIYYLNRTKFNLFPFFVFFLGLLPFMVLMFVVKDIYPAAILATNRPQGFTSYQQFLLPFISSFDPSFLFIKGDLTPYHSTGQQGMFLLATMPLFLIGLFKIAKDRKPFFLFVIAVFFLTPVLYGLPGSIHRASRLLALLPAFIIICLEGVKFLSEIKKKAIKIAVTSFIGILIMLNYGDFLWDYWNDYPNRVNQNFEKPLHTVYQRARELAQKEGLIVYIQDDAPLRNPITYSFFENAYFPNGLPRWKEGSGFPEKSIILISSQVYHRVYKPDYIETVENGQIDLDLLINRTLKNYVPDKP